MIRTRNWPTWIRRVGEAIREQAPLLGLTVLFLTVGFVVEGVTGLNDQTRNLRYLPSYDLFIRILPMPLPLAFLWGRLKVTDEHGVWLRGGPGWMAAWRRFQELYLNPRTVAAAVLAGFLVALNINLFGAWKMAIPKLHPFSWDARLAEADRMLHFGRQPWELLQLIVGHPSITNAIDFAYYGWLPLLVIVCAWQAWSPRRELRLRFFLTFILTWVLLGDVVATLFSSAGPCYYDRIVGLPNPYAGLMAYLTEVRTIYPISAPLGQELLWNLYSNAAQTPYTGISAMPSIHVAMPVLYALVGWRTWRPLGIAFGVYWLVILVGSVHLGWHYAVDGYVSTAMVVVIWFSVARAQAVQERRARQAA